MSRKVLVLLFRHVAQRGPRHCRHVTAIVYIGRCIAISHQTHNSSKQCQCQSVHGRGTSIGRVRRPQRFLPESTTGYPCRPP